MPKTGVLAEPPLIGRERELQELDLFLNSAVEGKGKTVFVSGEAGSGKTRLVTEFLNAIKKEDFTVLSSSCLSDVAVPYFPFMEAFGTYFSTHKDEKQESEIKSWFTGPSQIKSLQSKEPLTPQAWKDLAFVAITNALTSMASKKPIILFIEDIHWADSASLSLLHYASRGIRTSRAFVLATYRSEELTIDAEGKAHPLVETLRLMKREDLVKEVKLSNLELPSVLSIAEGMVGGSLDSTFVEKLSEESQGNALFVVESLRMLLERGSLFLDREGWHVSRDMVGIPFKFRDIILRRLDSLRFDHRRILDAASAIGEKFSPELLAEVLGQDNLEILEALNMVARSSSLVRFDGTNYCFDHAKSRQIIYEEIPVPLKKGYHARIAQLLEDSERDIRNLPVGELAFHWARAGNMKKSLQYSLQAGRDALARFSNAEAAKHYRYVLENTPDEPAYAEDRAIVQEGLADAIQKLGSFTEALNLYENIVRCVESGKVKLRVLGKAMLLSFFRGDYSHSLDLAKISEDYADADRLEFARVQLCRAMAVGETGNNKEARRLLEEAIRVFKEEYSINNLARALVELAVQLGRQGQNENAIFSVCRAVKMYEQMQDLQILASGYGHQGSTFLMSGLLTEALESEKKSVDIAEKIGNDQQKAWALFWCMSILLGLRKPEEAIIHGLKAVECAERSDAYLTKAINYSLLVSAFARLGKIELAEEYYGRLTKTLDGKEKLTYDRAGGGLQAASRASLLVAKGEWKEANAYYEKAIEASSKNAYDTNNSMEISSRMSYAFALAKQGRDKEARMQTLEAQRIADELQKRFEHVNVKSDLVVPRESGVGGSFQIRMDIGNISKTPSKLLRINNIIPPEFRALSLPPNCTLGENSLNFEDRTFEPFEIRSIELTLQTTKPGIFSIKPEVEFIDDLGETKTCRPETVSINIRPMLYIKAGEENVQVPILPDRISTGFLDLDGLLMGGIPEKYAVLLTSPPNDERELLIRRFLEAGAAAGKISFYLSAEAGDTSFIAEQFLSNFYLFLCNPRAETPMLNLPNVFKFSGIENLTDINISLVKAFRKLTDSAGDQRRAVVGIVSDVLLQHHALTTKKWLNGLLSDLRNQGFTTLAIINPNMHSPEDVHALMDLFDGEIRITEKETLRGTEKFLQIRRLSNQKYLEHELILTREKLRL